MKEKSLVFSFIKSKEGLSSLTGEINAMKDKNIEERKVE